MNDHDWDSGREFWSYYRQAEDSIFRGTPHQRQRFKRSMALMLREFMSYLSFRFVAWSTSYREVLSQAGNITSSALDRRLSTSNWSTGFGFDLESSWESGGSAEHVASFLSSLGSQLTSYTADDRCRPTDPSSAPGPWAARQAAERLTQGARRWAREAAWAVQEHHDPELVPTFRGLFQLPQNYTAFRRMDGESLKAALQEKLELLDAKQPGGIALFCFQFLLRTGRWSLDPSAEVSEASIALTRWCTERYAPEEEAAALKAGMSEVTAEPLLLEPLRLMDRNPNSRWVADFTLEISQQLGEREFQRMTTGLPALGGTAQECGCLWREAAAIEILNAVDLRLENAR